MNLHYRWTLMWNLNEFGEPDMISYDCIVAVSNLLDLGEQSRCCVFQSGIAIEWLRIGARVGSPLWRTPSQPYINLNRLHVRCGHCRKAVGADNRVTQWNVKRTHSTHTHTRTHANTLEPSLLSFFFISLSIIRGQQNDRPCQNYLYIHK